MSEPLGAAPLRTCVAQVANSLYLGGAEGQLVELLRSLGERYDFRVAVLHAAGPLLEQVRALGLAPTPFRPRGSLARPSTAALIVRMALWLNRERVELVHVHDFFASVLAVPAARLARCKVVVGRLDLGHWHGPLRRVALAQLTRKADHVIANAEAIRRLLTSREHIPSDRISDIRNGIDLNRFDERLKEEPASPLPDTGGAPRALLVANMNHPVKRQEDFLVALAHARAQGLPIQGLLVGDGPRRPQLEAFAEELGLGGAAHFLGHRTDVPAIAARCTVGVLCSTAEGLSNAIIEGMAARLPMVVTSAGGNPELVAHRERGLVIPPESPFELSAGVAYIVAHPRDARRMAAAGRAFVEAELSVALMAKNHDRLYQRLTRRTADGLTHPELSARVAPPGHLASHFDSATQAL
jgi:glycosyltransferase involved in cell wall biosynthesis